MIRRKSRGHYKAKMKFSFAFKRPYECAICGEDITAGKPYINLSASHTFNYTYFTLKFCPSCIAKELNNNKKYLKKEGFELWLKEQMANALVKNNTRMRRQ
jgi:hypothetical protein